MDGHETFKHAVDAARRGHARRASTRAGLDARRHRPVRLPPGQRAHPHARSASGSSSTAERVVDCIARARQHVGRDDPARARRCARATGRLRPGDRVLLGRRSAPASPGARRRRVGDAHERPRPTTRARSSPAPRRASAPRSPRALAADGWPVARQLPLRRGGRRARPSRRSRRPAARAVAVQGDVADATAADDAVRRPRSELGPVLVLVNNAGITRRRPRAPARATTSGTA